jgi:hypothetical protein
MREQGGPTYAKLEKLGGNFIRLNMPNGPKENDELVHVIDLWSHGARVIWNYARQQEMPILAAAADLATGSRTLPDTIANELESRTIAGQRAIMSTFFRALQEYMDKIGKTITSTFNPTWAALWDPWRQRVVQSADDWCDSVGLSKRQGQWMAVVRYPAWRATPLIRPTQLEGNWYGRHFATSPGCPPHKGGRIVEGRSAEFSRPDHLALAEYIHKPIAFELTDWLVAGFPALPTTRPVGQEQDLVRDRAAHWRALIREFTDARTWMTGPNCENISLAI